MPEYIEREALISEIQEEVDFKTPVYTEEQNKYFNMGLKCALRDVKRQPTADVVEVKVVKRWLYAIAITNVNVKFDGDFSKACEEIISRLDGLRDFQKKLEEGSL